MRMIGEVHSKSIGTVCYLIAHMCLPIQCTVTTWHHATTMSQAVRMAWTVLSHEYILNISHAIIYCQSCKYDWSDVLNMYVIPQIYAAPFEILVLKNLTIKWLFDHKSQPRHLIQNQDSGTNRCSKKSLVNHCGTAHDANRMNMWNYDSISHLAIAS